MIQRRGGGANGVLAKGRIELDRAAFRFDQAGQSFDARQPGRLGNRDFERAADRNPAGQPVRRGGAAAGKNGLLLRIGPAGVAGFEADKAFAADAALMAVEADRTAGFPEGFGQVPSLFDLDRDAFRADRQAVADGHGSTPLASGGAPGRRRLRQTA